MKFHFALFQNLGSFRVVWTAEPSLSGEDHLWLLETGTFRASLPRSIMRYSGRLIRECCIDVALHCVSPQFEDSFIEEGCTRYQVGSTT